MYFVHSLSAIKKKKKNAGKALSTTQFKHPKLEPTSQTTGICLRDLYAFTLSLRHSPCTLEKSSHGKGYGAPDTTIPEYSLHPPHLNSFPIPLQEATPSARCLLSAMTGIMHHLKLPTPSETQIRQLREAINCFLTSSRRQEQPP